MSILRSLIGPFVVALTLPAITLTQAAASVGFNTAGVGASTPLVPQDPPLPTGPEAVTLAGSSSVGSVPVFIPPAARSAGAARAVNAETTAAVVQALTEATAFCRRIGQQEYVVDCLSERLEAVRKQIDAGTQGYEAVSAALGDASRSLNQIARDNRSPDLPRARLQSQGADAQRSERAIVPVDQARLQSAAAQALAVIEETETVLLRSSEGSDERADQFQRISAAVGANKILLRTVG